MSLRPCIALVLLASACAPGQSGSASAGDDAGDACLLAPDPGNCDYAETRWYYDPDAQRCAPFTYSGCEGLVPFDEAPQCQSACESCDQLLAASAPPSEGGPSFTVRNTGAATLYLQTFTPATNVGAFRRQTFPISRSGQSVQLVTAPNDCDFSCELYDNAECSAACSDGGPPPPPIAIAPGGSYTAAWDGLHFADFAMPGRCLPAACADGLTCGRWQLAGDGDYDVRITHAAATDCALPECLCTPNAAGWCALPDGLQVALVDPQIAEAYFYFPTNEAVELSP